MLGNTGSVGVSVNVILLLCAIYVISVAPTIQTTHLTTPTPAFNYPGEFEAFGGIAILRCFVTGNPAPNVTWLRHSDVIDTNQGRFVLTSSGDLVIVQVRQTDTGSYVCLATNGLGAPIRREVQLHVTEPQIIPAFIYGDRNFTQIVDLNRPAVVRCPAGGHPAPNVSWWRNKNRLGLFADGFKLIRNYTLKFRLIRLSDLGPYSCEAYNGFGRSTTMEVTLKAYGPAGTVHPNDAPFMQYVIDPVVLKPSYPYRPYQPPPDIEKEFDKLATQLPKSTTECTGLSTDEFEDTTSTEVTTEGGSKKSCSFSELGCCPDGSIEAVGENFQGCENITCTKEPFGCCPDMQTPAHGPLGVGCCLNTPYGCCSDNILYASGPNFEGCDCEHTPHGCCPDKKTAARGQKDYGCSCEQTQFGCCPDKITPATGAKFEGCACHTMQHGCCPDGITFAKGPHHYSCHCSQTEFKCCDDDKTPAKGPNKESCTCVDSKYGCCSDGVNAAKGDKFEGCENIKEPPQKACGLPKDSGPCGNYSIKYFFDTPYGTCSRFWYGGCEGNGNNFETEAHCKEICEEYTGKEACYLPKSSGPCLKHIIKWYYDIEHNHCEEFNYGGCRGTSNRFDSLDECNTLCSVSETTPPCDQPMDEGPCEGSFERWFYDNETDVCRRFNYGGCKGNKNNYPTQHSCNYQCRQSGVNKDYCSLPKQPGDCSEQRARWHYSRSDKKCMPFYYTGCGGNKNNFPSLKSCEDHCPKEVDKGPCELPADVGECQNYSTMWYYDTKDERCRQFYYGGCGGTENRFATEDECISRCEREDKIPVQEPSILQPHVAQLTLPGDFCESTFDAGPCVEYVVLWYYNTTYGQCMQFYYGGCKGNQNRFPTEAACSQRCPSEKAQTPVFPPGNNTRHPGVEEKCFLQPDFGHCFLNVTRWYYDRSQDLCDEFEYSGCGGNGNNFKNGEECMHSCCELTTPEPPVQPAGLEPKTAKEMETESTVGGIAVLRCFATGNPAPNVTWSHHNVVVDTSQGRYFLTSSGDLAIVQVRQNDTGSYVCLASNGLGEPVSREVQLHVRDGEDNPAYIYGDKNFTQIVDLNKPVVVRCPAGGHPAPFVSWWRNKNILTLGDGLELTRYHALTFRLIRLSDLGPYTCEAYNARGRKASMKVTLKAYGPATVVHPNDAPFMQYVIDPAVLPTAAKPFYLCPPNRSTLASPPVIIPQARYQAIIVRDDRNNYTVASTIILDCKVDGYPNVTWFKDKVPLTSDGRIQVTANPHRLVIKEATLADSGMYGCVARNTFSNHTSEVRINIEAAIQVHPDCIDNPYYGACHLIVKGNYCKSPYYAKFCCRSCTLAGQLG